MNYAMMVLQEKLSSKKGSLKLWGRLLKKEDATKIEQVAYETCKYEIESLQKAIDLLMDNRNLTLVCGI
jgi:hypothetical protein